MRFSMAFLGICLTFSVVFSAGAWAGTWRRTNSDTVTFRGSIDSGEFEKFNAVFDDRVKNLVVTSAGGSVHDAIEIAEVLEKHDIKIIVKIWCLSSCANYFFTAAKTKVIEKGIVGFHGNANACFAKDFASEEALQKLREKYRGYGMNDEQVEKSILISTDMNRRELALLKRLGVSQELFERTCTPDKGMNNGKSYNFLLPTLMTFRQYGIYNVTGEQDQDTIEWFNGDLIVN